MRRVPSRHRGQHHYQRSKRPDSPDPRREGPCREIDDLIGSSVFLQNILGVLRRFFNDKKNPVQTVLFAEMLGSELIRIFSLLCLSVTNPYPIVLAV